jgi:hypothetical protein
MNTSTTAAVIFVAVWLLIVLLYCVFRACGGRLVDILSCACCSGPCASCWGTGGRIYENDPEYPFGDDSYQPYVRGQLPLIIVQNGGGGRNRDRDSSGDEESDDGEGGSELRELESHDGEGRGRAPNALLLRNRTHPDEAEDPGGPVVV